MGRAFNDWLVTFFFFERIVAERCRKRGQVELTYFLPFDVIYRLWTAESERSPVNDTCNLLARRIQIKKPPLINESISWGTNRQSELRGVATGGFPSVCVKARTKARSSSRRSSTSTNHQNKIATKINIQLSSSRRLIMLQKSSSAHWVRAYYHSFLSVQMECHTHWRYPTFM